MLKEKCRQDPETNGLKRLLAVKKSLSEFEQRVEHVRKVNRGEPDLILSVCIFDGIISGGAASAGREQRSDGPLSHEVVTLPKIISRGCNVA